MEKYRKFLKCLLSVNIMFVLLVAGLGYREQMHKKEITQVSNSLSATNKKEKSSLEETVTVENDISVAKAIPMGNTVGIYINTKGILVIDTGEVTGMDGKNSTPAKNKLIQGDYITGLNGEEMKTKKQLVDAITSCDGETLVFQVIRNDEKIDIQVEPVQTDVDTYKVGIWVKDDLQGLGTITYVIGDSFGSLGHSVNDTDTGEILEVSGGEIYEADIFGVEKGAVGTPGEIEGMIAYDTENVVGHIDDNRLYGIFGTLTEDYMKEINTEDAVEVAGMDEVKKGKAYIQSYVSGSKELYEIEIVDIHKNDNGDAEMEIKIVDEDLINLTGGIVQGMSGSPILQNGKLIGAVTHVFVEDPTRGYGIFIEEMMERN